MISYEVGKRYDAAIREEGTQFDLADDGAFLAVYFSRPEEKGRRSRSVLVSRHQQHLWDTMNYL